MSPALTGVIVIVVALALVAAAVLAGRWLRSRMLDPPGVRSAAQALWTAGLAAPPLREGLTPRSAAHALPYLLALLETSGVALCGPDGGVLGADGPGAHHADEVSAAVTLALRSDRRQLAKCSPCGVAGCSVSRAVISPLIADGRAVGACGAHRSRRRTVSGQGDRRDRALHLHPIGIGGPGRIPCGPGKGRDQGAACADLPAVSSTTR